MVVIPTHFQNGDVKRPATEIKDHDLLFFAGFIQTISEAGGRRLIDDTKDFESRDLTGVLGGLALVIIKIGRTSDNGFFNFVAKVFLSVSLDLLQNKSADLLGRIFFAENFILMICTHLAF